MVPVSGALSTSDMALLYNNYDALIFSITGRGMGATANRGDCLRIACHLDIL